MHRAMIRYGLRSAALRTAAILALGGAVTGGAAADSQRWTPIGPYGQSASVRSLAVDPTNPSILYAGIDDQTHNRGGVLKSTDGGQTWTRFDFSQMTYVFTLAIDPSAPSTVFAGGRTMYRTQDGGATWNEVSTGLVGDVFSIAVDPHASSVVYTAAGGGVQKSTDGGATWRDSSAGLPLSIGQIAIDATSPSTLYYAGDASNGGIFKSTDGGASWTPVNGLGAVDAQTVFVSRAAAPGVYASTSHGVYRSGNGGASWESAGSGLQGSGVTSFAAGSDALYAGTGLGVFRSTDGRAWSALGSSTLATTVWAVALGSPSGSTIFAGTDTAGVFRSLDGGADWAASNVGLTGAVAAFIAVDPTAPTQLVAGLSPPDVLKSGDRGATWTDVNPDPSLEAVSALALDPSSSGVFYVARSRDGVFKTTDGGATWRHADAGLAVPPLFGSQYVTALAIDPSAPATLYAGLTTIGFGLFVNGYVFKSTDGGGIWAQLPVGLQDGRVFAVAVDARSNTVYAPGARSTDGGVSWQALDGPCNASWTGAIAVAADSTVYMACDALYKSKDHAATWETLAGAGNATSVVVDPIHPLTVYAGGPSGVLRTVDGGATFTLFADGLTNPSVTSLAIDPDNPARVYAGTATTGFYARDFSGSAPTLCASSATTLCLLGGRFAAEVSWSVPSDGRSGSGMARALTTDTGSFWFFSEDNVELVLKVLDGRALNGAFWVFYGALSDVQYTITVTDTETGATRRYDNPAGTLASRADTGAFPMETSGSSLVAARSSATEKGSDAETYGRYAARARPGSRREAAVADTADCVSGGRTLCLDARYLVSVEWEVPAQGVSGSGAAMPLTGDTGYFWFFEAPNIELVVKVLDGEAVNGHRWVFYGALSNVKYTITVEDTVTGATRNYENASGQLASVADTTAF